MSQENRPVLGLYRSLEIPALEAEECPPKLHLQKTYFTEMYGIKVVQNYMFALTFAPMSGSNSDVATGVFLLCVPCCWERVEVETSGP